MRATVSQKWIIIAVFLDTNSLGPSVFAPFHKLMLYFVGCTAIKKDPV